MFHKKLKQMGAWALAFSLLLGSVQLPALEAKAADENLARTATVSASSVEAATLPAEKANDGDDTTRWASAVSSDAQTLQLSWDSVQTMKSFVVKWERRNATEYAIEILKDGTWESVASFNQKPTNTVQEITLNAPVQAKDVRLNIKAHSAAGAEGETSWNNVSVWEFEVYEGEIPDNRTEMEKLVDSIQAPQVSADGTHISMPELPEGATARFCADYEQVIGEDGTVYTPVESKTVKGFYEVTKGEETAKTDEFTVTVPGQYTNAENANVKPAVIPELQEWHGTSGQFAVSGSSRIIAEEGLEDTAESFAADYKEITGQDIQVVKGSSSDAKVGDFCLELVEDNQGLGKEGYVMTVGNFVKIEASDAVGAYWGVVSVLQILKQTNGSIPKGIARDYPKYEVRAFSFDVGRKPISLDAVTQVSKNMSWYKMNSLQLHLSDNLIFHEDYSSLKEAQENSYAGFRLESSLKPEEDSMVDTLHSQDLYYTKDEMRSLVRESRGWGVNIVPEFDMPAHALPITRAFPSLQSTTAAGNHNWLIEELDLTQINEATKLAEEIWNDYFTDYDGNGPVFDEETTVHIGTDEFHGGNHAGGQVADQEGRELFRQFSANMIKFIQDTGRTVRMWGSLTNKAGTTQVPSEKVQLNVWNTGYADPAAMYDLGYDLINTLEGQNYIVPAAGYYNDYVNAQSVYSSWQPNVIGNKTLMAGDDQMLGGCYAIWHDSIDTRGNGISEYDSFDRFFKPVPAYGAKLWGDAKDRNYKEFTAVVENTGTAPGTTLYGEVDSATKTILNYTFDETVEKDSSANAYNGTESKNVSQTVEGNGKALKLNGGESYVETPEKIDKISDGASLTVRVKMDADADGEQILCESKDEFGAYGTYAIKAVQKNTGKVGFSREGYDYSFNYTLPKGEWVELTFKSGNGTAELYVNGELVDNKKYDEDGNLATTTNSKGQALTISKNNNPDIYFANHPETELSEKLAKEGITKTATLMLPVGRIGSKTKSFKGEIDYLTVAGTKESSVKLGLIPQSDLTAGACSTHPTEGSIEAMLDGDTSTYWHTNYNLASEKEDTKDHDHYITLTLKDAKTVNKLTYLPRQNHENGRITEYKIDIVKPDGTTVENYASGTWASDVTEKTVSFEPIEAKTVKLVILASGSGNHGTAAELNLYEPVTFGGNELQQEIDKYADYAEKDYTSTSWNAFVHAREEALKVVNSADSTQDDCVYAYGELQKAAAALTVKPAVYKLIDVVAEADEVNKEDYEAAEYGEYEKALAAAQEVLADVNATEAQITEAVKRVSNAKAALVPKRDVNTEKISTSIADAEKLLENTAGYTAASVAALKEAVAKAKAVLENPKATQAEVDAALKALQDAKLVKEESSTPGKPNPTPNPTPSVPAAGTVITVKDVQYKVTKSDAQNGTAVAVKLMKKTAKKITIQSAVTIDGVTFKVTEVNAKVFQKAKKLTTVTIGANVKKIGAKAFFKCAKLKKVTFKGTKAPSIGKQAFKGTAAKCKVTAPKKMVKKQKKLLKTRLKKAGISKKAVIK